jgi:hypothetical protein
MSDEDLNSIDTLIKFLHRLISNKLRKKKFVLIDEQYNSCRFMVLFHNNEYHIGVVDAQTYEIALSVCRPCFRTAFILFPEFRQMAKDWG